ncbi:MAG TPA: hypothetical protein VLL52_20245, partial [Anaerolineae bacterium]|nr:hypothetical protein [Anaerolineae bacterium]
MKVRREVEWPRLTYRASALFVLLVAGFARLYALQDVPPGLVRDETLNADIAMFIRQGRHALFFREGFGHEPLYHYLAAPWAVLWGDNYLAVRLPSVFIGLLLVAVTMGWARRAFGEGVSLVTGVLLAVSWWPVVFSRIGLRPILLPLCMVLAAWYIRRKPVVAGVWLAAGIYSYTAGRVAYLLPLGYGLTLGLSGAYRNREGVRWWRPWLAAGTAFGLYLPLAYVLWRDPSLQERVRQLEGPLTALRVGDWGPLAESVLGTLGVFSVAGDPLWSYGWPGVPLFGLGLAFLFYSGLVVAAGRAWGEGSYQYLLLWLGWGLVPSGVTPDAPSLVRLVGGMPALYTLVGIGGVYWWEVMERRLGM